MSWFGRSSKKWRKAQESSTSLEKAFSQIEDEIMDLDEFRDRINTLIWYENMQGLHDLCEDQFIMTGIVIEKIINEIAPGNSWNDVLFLMGRKMIEVSPGLIGVWETELQAKRHLVQHPDGGREVMAPFVRFS
jgi:hypothetical protein